MPSRSLPCSQGDEPPAAAHPSPSQPSKQLADAAPPPCCPCTPSRPGCFAAAATPGSWAWLLLPLPPEQHSHRSYSAAELQLSQQVLEQSCALHRTPLLRNPTQAATQARKLLAAPPRPLCNLRFSPFSPWTESSTLRSTRTPSVHDCARYTSALALLAPSPSLPPGALDGSFALFSCASLRHCSPSALLFIQA